MFVQIPVNALWVDLAGTQRQTRAASIRFQAERKAGEFLGEMALDKGGRPKLTTPTKPEGVSTTIADLGLTKKESHRFQLLARVPEPELVKLIGALLDAP